MSMPNTPKPSPAAPAVLQPAAPTPAVPTTPPPAPSTEKRRIRDGVFWYAFPDTAGQGLAYRGDIVDLTPADIKRGEKHGSFMDSLDDEPPAPAHSTLAVVPAEADDTEFDSLVLSGTVPEVVAYVNAHPEQAERVLSAEERRGKDARVSLLESLATLVDSRK